MTTDRVQAIFGRRPLVLAPMAGGPSTPELCAAVGEAGGLGFLAGGYLAPEALGAAVDAVEGLTGAPYGVNVFVPEGEGRLEPWTGDDTEIGARPGVGTVSGTGTGTGTETGTGTGTGTNAAFGTDADAPAATPIATETETAYAAYRERLIADEAYAPEVFPSEPRWSADHYEEKLELILRSSASCVSFTFGHPGAATIRRLQEAGKAVVLYATSRPGLRAIAASGADVVGVQGIAAGGHRASVVGADDDSSEDAVALTAYARGITDRPIIAGGGVAGADDVARLLRAGARAVQVGTLFLTAREAGTKATHRRALLELTDRETMLTRAFSGREARTIRNGFARRHSAEAPRLYPQIHYLTARMRAEADAAGDPERLNLWAGEGFAACREVEAARLVEELTPSGR